MGLRLDICDKLVDIRSSGGTSVDNKVGVFFGYFGAADGVAFEAKILVDDTAC